jgi:hypothetical protein
VSATAADDFKAQHDRAVSDNPAGVHFAIAVRDGQTSFRIGERITLDYTFTVDVPGNYLAGATNMDQSGRSTFEKFVVDRPDDAADPPLAGMLFRRQVIDHGWTPELSNFIVESWYDSFGGKDLDEYFAKVFAGGHTEDMERNASLLARFGTAAILPQIKQVYEVPDAKCRARCKPGCWLISFASILPMARLEREFPWRSRTLKRS